ncbi:MAG: glycosyl hydrolase family 18 protein [Pirellulales bacterium]
MKLCQQYRLNGIDLDWEHPKNESEQTGYATILADLRRAFHTKSLSVSMTMAAWQQVPRVAFEAVDFVQIMSYDKPMQHSTLKDAINDIEKLSSDGAPRSKLVLGIPFYGRHTKTPDQTKTYREIVERWNPSPSSDEVEGYYFNGPETIAAKTRYARDHGLAGVMIWEVGQDASGEQSLLKKISFAAKLDGEQK